jgi:uncharacterized protein (DUF1499 family)
MMSFFSYKPSNLGMIDGRLADCPASPNCVSTQAVDADHRMEPIPFTSSPDEMMQRIEAVIAEMTQTKIVTTEGNYLHAEFRSALFRFVDDVEFLIDPESQLVHFRSVSRVGYSDFGVNRRRMEEIREAFGK